jgi:hypothetical protein
MNSNRDCRWVAGVGIAVAAALIGLAPAARADDMQISIDGYDLFPTAGNTATALSSTGDMAIAIGNGADASALNDPAETGNFGNFAFADGTGETANAGGGILDTALTFGGIDSTTYAGFNGNFDIAVATASNDTVAAGVGTEANPANFDFASAADSGYVMEAGPQNFQFLAVLPDGTVVDPAAAVPAAWPQTPNTDPFQDLYGDSGINSWTPEADSWLNTNDPTLAASLGQLVFDEDSSGIPAPGINIIGQLDPGAYSDQGGSYLPADWLGDLANTLDFSLYASGLAPVLDPAILDTFQWTEGIILSPLLLLAGFFA